MSSSFEAIAVPSAVNRSADNNITRIATGTSAQEIGWNFAIKEKNLKKNKKIKVNLQDLLQTKINKKNKNNKKWKWVS